MSTSDESEYYYYYTDDEGASEPEEGEGGPQKAPSEILSDFDVISPSTVSELIRFYEGVLKRSVSRDAFTAVTRVVLNLKDLRVHIGEYGSGMQGVLGDRLYTAAILRDYCIVCLKVVSYAEGTGLRIRCPTCQAVEYCSGYCSLENNTHPCLLLARLRLLSQCREADLDTYRLRKDATLERTLLLKRTREQEELLADESQSRRDGSGRSPLNANATNLDVSGEIQLVLTESDQYILSKLQPICNVVEFTRRLYSQTDEPFLKELTSAEQSISLLRVRDPFAYAFVLKIAYLFNGGMSKVSAERERLEEILKTIRVTVTEFESNYSSLENTLVELQRLMCDSSHTVTDLGVVTATYQTSRNLLALMTGTRLPEQCQDALRDITKMVFYWNQVRMYNFLVSSLSRYSDLLKEINLQDQQKRVLHREVQEISMEIQRYTTQIDALKSATVELQTKLDKLKLGIVPTLSSGQSHLPETPISSQNIAPEPPVVHSVTGTFRRNLRTAVSPVVPQHSAQRTLSAQPRRPNVPSSAPTTQTRRNLRHKRFARENLVTTESISTPALAPAPAPTSPPKPEPSSLPKTKLDLTHGPPSLLTPSTGILSTPPILQGTSPLSDPSLLPPLGLQPSPPKVQQAETTVSEDTPALMVSDEVEKQPQQRVLPRYRRTQALLERAPPNLQRVSRNLQHFTAEVHRTGILFLARIWTLLSRALLWSDRLDGYSNVLHAQVEEELTNIRFHNYCSIRMAHLRFSANVTVGKYHDDAQVVRRSLTADQAHRLDHLGALSIDTSRLTVPQRQKLYVSLSEYIRNGTPVDPQEILA
ncbi:hypothetical protein GMRT_10086 [Giardia muris]|uniref:Uncharacterized protein n=1 Tax=Giardia muris TaxID=5742 RepID=A0A4Z1SWV1_GIAMU|nr:hypothetical protein GMRT_10086 [Giardia muris]|eukprot:TNJ26203.1 hypothetical protein GMRT_10086 [Giardia muris]